MWWLEPVATMFATAEADGAVGRLLRKGGIVPNTWLKTRRFAPPATPTQRLDQTHGSSKTHQVTGRATYDFYPERRPEPAWARALLGGSPWHCHDPVWKMFFLRTLL